MSSTDDQHPFGPPPRPWLETAEHGKSVVVVDVNIPTGPDADPLALRLLDIAKDVLAERVDHADFAATLSLGEAAHWFRMMNKKRIPLHVAFGVSEKAMSGAVRTWQSIQHNQEDVAADLRRAFLELSKKRGFE